MSYLTRLEALEAAIAPQKRIRIVLMIFDPVRGVSAAAVFASDGTLRTFERLLTETELLRTRYVVPASAVDRAATLSGRKNVRISSTSSSGSSIAAKWPPRGISVQR